MKDHYAWKVCDEMGIVNCFDTPSEVVMYCRQLDAKGIKYQIECLINHAFALQQLKKYAETIVNRRCKSE
jgi:hypothetical protein